MSTRPRLTSNRTQIGIGLSPDLLRLDRSRMLDLVAQINESEIDHVVVTDHVSFRGGRGRDGLAALHYLAGLGIERELHTGVLLLPLRHPTLVARQLLDLAEIHPYGVVAGVGLGGDDDEEYTMLGMTTANRGARMDDALDLLLQLLAGDSPVAAEGHYPATGPGLRTGDSHRVPVLVGGRVGQSLERAALADGWLAAFCSASRFEANGEKVRKSSPDATLGYQLWFGTSASTRNDADAQIARFYGLDPEPFRRYVPLGDAALLAEHLSPYAEAGATVFSLFPVSAPEAAVEQLSAIASALHKANPQDSGSDSSDSMSWASDQLGDISG